MIYILLLIGYVINVYYTRHLNKLVRGMSQYAPIWPIMWFAPVIGPIFFTLIYLVESSTSSTPNWFKIFIGKNW